MAFQGQDRRRKITVMHAYLSISLLCLHRGTELSPARFLNTKYISFGVKTQYLTHHHCFEKNQDGIHNQPMCLQAVKFMNPVCSDGIPLPHLLSDTTCIFYLPLKQTDICRHQPIDTGQHRKMNTNFLPADQKLFFFNFKVIIANTIPFKRNAVDFEAAF